MDRNEYNFKIEEMRVAVRNKDYERALQIADSLDYIGKNTVKSRFGVIHSWMFEMHSKVPCILQIPSTKQIAQSKGRTVT